MAYRRASEGNESVVDQTVNRIRQSIRIGDFVPGQRLVAAEISEELSASVSAVREALTRLAGEGLIDIQPHRGAVVRPQTREDIIEIFELREVIEGLAARLAAQAVATGTRTTTELKYAANQCREHAEKVEYIEYALANHAFHDAIYALAGKTRVTRLAEQLSVQIDRLNNRRLARISVLQQSSIEHEAILTAIISGNEAAAEAAMRQHVRTSMQRILGTD